MKKFRDFYNYERINESVTCPNCGHVQPFGFHLTITQQESPLLFEKVLDGSIFSFTCSNCHEDQILVYNLMVIDFSDKYFIHLIQDPDDIEETIVYLYDSHMFSHEKDFKFRIVRTAPELMEKMKIFIDDYNDKVMELLKIKIREDLEEEFESIVTRLEYLETRSDNELFFVAELMNEKIVYHNASMEEYIKTKLGNEIILNEHNLVIDFNWAREEIG